MTRGQRSTAAPTTTIFSAAERMRPPSQPSFGDGSNSNAEGEGDTMGNTLHVCYDVICGHASQTFIQCVRRNSRKQLSAKKNNLAGTHLKITLHCSADTRDKPDQNFS